MQTSTYISESMVGVSRIVLFLFFYFTANGANVKPKHLLYMNVRMSMLGNAKACATFVFHNKNALAAF